MAKTTYKGLLSATIEAAAASKVPIRTVEYDPSTKKLRVEFDRTPAPAPVDATAAAVAGTMAAQRQSAEAARFIPGTRIVDDGSPVDAMELAETRPRYGLDPEPRDGSNGVA